MKPELIEKLKKYIEELDSATEDLNKFSETDLSSMPKEEVKKFKAELSDKKDKFDVITAKIKDIKVHANLKIEKLESLKEEHPLLTIEDVGGYPGEVEDIENMYNEFHVPEKFDNLSDTLSQLEGRIVEREDFFANEKMKQEEAEKEKREQETKRKHEEKKNKVLEFLSSDFEDKAKIRLRDSTFSYTNDFEKEKNYYKQVIVPVSEAKVKLIELTDQNCYYNYHSNHSFGSALQYDEESKGTTRFKTLDELRKAEDYDGIEAIKMYEERVKEVNASPDYEHKFIKVTFPVEGEEVEFSCSEADLAKKLGMLAIDLMPPTDNMLPTTRSAKDCFKNALELQEMAELKEKEGYVEEEEGGFFSRFRNKKKRKDDTK
ncbi:MAG: hypothetical protein IKR04_06005 [Clostridia bacterium]|nr:hypothetical protein [Clostridia bacterium]